MGGGSLADPASTKTALPHSPFAYIHAGNSRPIDQSPPTPGRQWPAANATVDPAILADPGTYSPQALRAKLYTKNGNSPAFNRALTRAFSKLKSGL